MYFLGKCALRVSLTALLLGVSATHADVPRIVEPIDESVRVSLPGHVQPALKYSVDLGHADRSQRAARLILVLRSSDTQESALQAYLSRVQDRRSPDYRHWLTTSEFGAQYGVDAADRATLRSWLAAKGFRDFEEPNGARSILFSATFGQLEDAFGLSIRRYRWHGEPHLAAANDPSIPRALAPIVRGFASLHDFRRQPQLIRATAPLYSVGGTNYLGPADFATIYDLNPTYAGGNTAAGSNIAVLGRTDVSQADLSNYRSFFGLSAATPTVIVNGTDPGIVAGDELESDLDLEWAGGVAKSAQIVFVTSASTSLSDGIDLSAQYAVSNNVADIISLSYGACEAATDVTSGTTYYNQLWQQAVAQGISVFVSSGDSGAAGCDSSTTSPATHGLGVNELCSSPYSTCVGGTEFSADVSNPSTYWSSANGSGQSSALTYIPEVVWNESGSSDLYASGGGASILFAKPAWQYATGVPSDGRRDVPDVALNAATGHDPYLVYSSDPNYFHGSTLAGVGGTSAAAPSLAGIAALLAHAQGGRIGNLNPTLYALSNAQANDGAAVFHRITSGNNSVPGQSGFSASSGDPNYNQATGLGSVDGGLLISSWNTVASTGAQLQPTSVTLPPSQFVGSAVLTLTSSSAWTASASSSGNWLSVTPGSGSGSAPLTYAAAANSGASSRTGTITVAGQVLTVTQAAASGSAKLALSASSLNFGSDPVSDSSSALRLLASNTGDATLTLGTVSLTGAASDYTEAGTCVSGLALIAGASCYLDITFDPSTVGAHAAALSIAVSGGTAGSVSLTGTGVADANADGPLPLWAVLALGAGILGLGRRRLGCFTQDVE
jgi:subtilase family serine protease